MYDNLIVIHEICCMISSGLVLVKPNAPYHMKWYKIMRVVNLLLCPMWETVRTNDEILRFMGKMCDFHDSCIKEMHYMSGAYIDENFSMHPLNDRRVLQRQCETDSMIEMEFQGLKRLQLAPVDEDYTCEISDSAMMIKDGNIYWCDCGDLSESDLGAYEGTLICAAEFRWRSIENHMGEKEFYHSAV